MKSLSKKMMGLSLLLALTSMVVAHADDAADIADLPVGSSMTLPMQNMLVDAQSTSVRLITFQRNATPADVTAMTCSLSFPASSVDRQIQGILTMSETTPVTDSGGVYTFNGTYTLNGNALPLTLTCYAFETDNQQAYGGAPISLLRSYLQSQGGSLTVPAPIPFGQ